MHAPAHISQDSDSESLTKVVSKSRKHSVCTHFPKGRNCEVCLRTKMTRAPCWRRTGDALLRAEKFGDLITADHKVLSDNCESRNNHRYAVVVQDLATQWIQAYPCKNKTSQETQRSLQKFLEPNRKWLDNFEEWKKVLQQYCYKQDWMKNGGLIPWNAIAICEISKTSWQKGKTPYERWFGEPCKGPVIPFLGNSWISSDFYEVFQIRGKDSRSSLHWKKNLLRDICGLGRD